MLNLDFFSLDWLLFPLFDPCRFLSFRGLRPSLNSTNGPSLVNDCGDGVRLPSCLPVLAFSFFGILNGFFSFLTFWRVFSLKFIPLDVVSVSFDVDPGLFSLSGGGEGLLLDSVSISSRLLLSGLWTPLCSLGFVEVFDDLDTITFLPSLSRIFSSLFLFLALLEPDGGFVLSLLLNSAFSRVTVLSESFLSRFLSPFITSLILGGGGGVVPLLSLLRYVVSA